MRLCFIRKNDYENMRIISEELYAGLIRVLAKDETVAAFQQLLLSPKTAEAERTETKKSETEKADKPQGGDE